ncbi:maleylpyruvate isomerase N-terminal domain-containing protein [Amycolatopsis benzoatilytica]|uniref:maleylpyruvate isomerase N-terminal domain-containing protein n=1 Tax=Amycolatopsis benzoatilytica TaxID=346045 RepID=UPI0003A73050|nr:maleylpyruvate isomerase N-terminal domain-containing protein [Amycolatopsis benzoatilytica]
MDLFSRAWNDLRRAVRSLEGGQWLTPSGCTGWLVQDLVFHLIIDAQDVLITLATPTGAEPTRTASGYWELGGEPPTGLSDEDKFTRRSAACYRSGASLVHHFEDLAAAAGRAAVLADRAARVETRGQVLTVADYFETYVVESTLHHLDLVAYLSGVDGPSAQCLAAARQTVETVLGEKLPAELDDRAALLVRTGRRSATEDETAMLGDLAGKLPVVLG